MQSIQTGHILSLSAVKPLDGLLRYREYCLSETKKALLKGGKKRIVSPINGESLEKWATIDGIEYLIAPSCGSLFLAELPGSKIWEGLLCQLSEYRNASSGFHGEIAKSRLANVLEPKLHWVLNGIRLAGLKKPKVLEVAPPPSLFLPLLQNNVTFGEVVSLSEAALVRESSRYKEVDAIIFLESLDRTDDPLALLQAARHTLSTNGLLFLTSFVASGFDTTLLGAKNAYLYPPDRANCFTLNGLQNLLEFVGFELLEVSTPGVLDLEVVKSHLKQNADIQLSSFERKILEADGNVANCFQSFLQQSNFSSFARITAKLSN